MLRSLTESAINHYPLRPQPFVEHFRLLSQARYIWSAKPHWDDANCPPYANEYIHSELRCLDITRCLAASLSVWADDPARTLSATAKVDIRYHYSAMDTLPWGHLGNNYLDVMYREICSIAD